MTLRELLYRIRWRDTDLENMRREILKIDRGDQNQGVLKIINKELYVKYKDEIVPFDLLSWKDLIDCEIESEIINELGRGITAEIILEELSFYGMTAEENKKKIADMFKRVDCLDYILSLCE